MLRWRFCKSLPHISIWIFLVCSDYSCRLMFLSQTSITHSYSSSQIISPACARETNVVLAPAWCSNTDAPPSQPRVPTLPRLQTTSFQSHIHSTVSREAANVAAGILLIPTTTSYSNRLTVGHTSVLSQKWRWGGDKNRSVPISMLMMQRLQSLSKPVRASKKNECHMAQSLLPSTAHVTKPSFFLYLLWQNYRQYLKDAVYKAADCKSTVSSNLLKHASWHIKKVQRAGRTH